MAKQWQRQWTLLAAELGSGAVNEFDACASKPDKFIAGLVR